LFEPGKSDTVEPQVSSLSAKLFLHERSQARVASVFNLPLPYPLRNHSKHIVSEHILSGKSLSDHPSLNVDVIRLAAPYSGTCPNCPRDDRNGFSALLKAIASLLQSIFHQSPRIGSSRRREPLCKDDINVEAGKGVSNHLEGGAVGPVFMKRGHKDQMPLAHAIRSGKRVFWLLIAELARPRR
jgi:hypothetical protein